VLLEVLLHILHLGVVVGGERLEEVVVSHDERPVFVLLRSEGFEDLFGRREEANLVLVSAPDLVLPGGFFAEILLLRLSQ